MSVFNVKSIWLTNRDATPPRLSNPEISQGYQKAVVGVEKTSNMGSDLGAAGSAIRLISIPSNARLHSLEYGMGALGTSTLDITAWYPTTIPQGGQTAPASTLAGTVVMSSLFASNLAGIDTSLGWTDAFGKDATPALTNRAKPLWQVLGLSTDPELDFDFGYTMRVAVSINGYVGLKATYVD